MLFNSQIFLFLFLPITLILYYAIRNFSSRFAIRFLSVASIVFYAYWKIEYTFILIASILINYVTYIYIFRTESTKRKFIAITSIISINLAILLFYKYSGFFINEVLNLAVLNFQSPVLPLAISFFTFQQISFIVDESNLKEERVRFDEYVAFVTFFPQLIAGPIVRHNELIPQLRAPRISGSFIAGIVMLGLGLGKKVLIADSFSVWANRGFAHGEALNFSDAWLASLSYTFQLYFDFSGYSDMAIGLGLLFGFTLPQNFNSPYKSTSIQDFWRRWHMTLSRWLRDYLYIPLGGSKKGGTRTYANLFLTMLLGGIWHGAGWTFFLWGGMHGVALAVNRLWSSLNVPLPKGLSWLITFTFVVVAWVFFRAASFEDGSLIVSKMFALGGSFSLPPSWANAGSEFFAGLGAGNLALPSSASVLPLRAWLVMGVFLVIVTRAPNSNEIVLEMSKPLTTKRFVILAFVGFIFALAVKRLMEHGVQSEFLYFQF